jgi:RecA/RadA recombinase
LQFGESALPVLSTERVRRLSLGVPAVDNIFPGFEAGDFAVVYGDEVSFMAFALCVRCILPTEKGGLGSSVAFVDGGNSFNPYLVADLARIYDLDPRAALERAYVSRAFTAYQLSSLILEKLEPFLNVKKSRLLVVSDIASLFLDRDVPKTEAKDLFIKVCAKLSEIAEKKQTLVLATYYPERSSKRGLFLEAVLFGRSNVIVKFERRGSVLRFVLQDHPRIKPFSIDFQSEDVQLTNYMEV